MRFANSVLIHFCIGGNQEVKKKTKAECVFKLADKRISPLKMLCPQADLL